MTQVLRFICAINTLNWSSGARNVLLTSVHPHARMMIESVSKLLPDEFNSKCESCIPALSAESFFGKEKTYTSSSLSTSQAFLEALEYESRKDDVRRAENMTNAWVMSILEEIKKIREGLGTQKTENGKVSAAVNALGGSLPAGPLIVNPALDSVTDEGSSSTPKLKNLVVEEQAGAVARHNTNPADGPRLNSPDGWKALSEHHATTGTTLTAVIARIEDLGKASIELFRDHRNTVIIGSGYNLRWPKDGMGEKIESILLPKPEPDLSSVSVTNFNWDDFDGQVQLASEKRDESAATIEAFVRGTTAPSSPTPISTVPLATTRPFSERMSELNAKLNWLNSLRLGNEDAQRSLVALIGSVKTAIQPIITEINKSLTKIKAGLDELKKENFVYRVYRDAKAFTGEEASDSSPTPTPNFEKAIAALEGAIRLQNNHASLPGRTKYILDTIRIMHANLIALHDAHNVGAPYSNTPAVPTNIGTQILSVHSSIPDAASGRIDGPAGIKTTLSTVSKNAQVTTKCILYGQVDGAQVFETLSTTPSKDLCTDVTAYGMDVINKEFGAYMSNGGG